MFQTKIKKNKKIVVPGLSRCGRGAGMTCFSFCPFIFSQSGLKFQAENLTDRLEGLKNFVKKLTDFIWIDMNWLFRYDDF